MFSGHKKNKIINDYLTVNIYRTLLYIKQQLIITWITATVSRLSICSGDRSGGSRLKKKSLTAVATAFTAISKSSSEKS